MADPRLAAVLATARDPGVAEQARGQDLAKRLELLERASRFVPVVTNLPVNPFEGQEVLFEANAGSGVYWRLKYVGSQPAGKRWVCQGGTPLRSTDSAQNNETLGSAGFAYQDMVSSPTFVLPFAGDWDIEFGLTAARAVALDIEFKVTTTANASVTNPLRSKNQNATAWTPLHGKWPAVGLPSGGLKIREAGGSVTPNAFSTLERYLFAMPVRVG